jgi:hypothetical protein
MLIICGSSQWYFLFAVTASRDATDGSLYFLVYFICLDAATVVGARMIDEGCSDSNSSRVEPSLYGVPIIGSPEWNRPKAPLAMLP